MRVEKYQTRAGVGERYVKEAEYRREILSARFSFVHFSTFSCDSRDTFDTLFSENRTFNQATAKPYRVLLIAHLF